MILLDFLLNRDENISQKNLQNDTYRSFIYDADTWQQLKYSSVEWIILVYSDNAYYLELKKKCGVIP